MGFRDFFVEKVPEEENYDVGTDYSVEDSTVPVELDEVHTDTLIDDIYAQNELSDRSKSIFKIEELINSLPKEMVTETKRGSVLASMTQLNRTLASVAQQVQNRDESKWLFDFDIDDKELLGQFRTDLGLLGIHNDCHKTPHGYAVIAEHGFDTRELMKKWKDYDITLKKDELLFLDMITNK